MTGDAAAPSRGRAVAQLAIAGLFAAVLVGGAWAATRNRIAAAEREAHRQALELVLPPGSFDNDPEDDALQVDAAAWLGADTATVRRARRGDRPPALVLDVVAPDGYAGPIRLLVAVDADSRVIGVRVTGHRETPGLGDAIEPTRSDWLAGFRGRSLADPMAGDWRVRRDGGRFDQFAGATQTPRAVVGAVARTLAFVARHGDALRDAPAGTTLRFDDAPDALPPPETGR